MRLVVVIGVQTLIDTTLRERGMTPRYMNGYRITDPATLKVTIEVAGEVRTLCEQALSKVSKVLLRGRGDGAMWVGCT